MCLNTSSAQVISPCFKQVKHNEPIFVNVVILFILTYGPICKTLAPGGQYLLSSACLEASISVGENLVSILKICSHEEHHKIHHAKLLYSNVVNLNPKSSFMLCEQVASPFLYALHFLTCFPCLCELK